MGASGGRFDQEMATLHCLHKWRGNFLRIILLNEVSLIFLLEANQKHQLEIMKGIEGPTCGLVPLAGRADSVTTTGLFELLIVAIVGILTINYLNCFK